MAKDMARTENYVLGIFSTGLGLSVQKFRDNCESSSTGYYKPSYVYRMAHL
jgi:hypothetical protein